MLSLDDWNRLSDERKAELARTWNPYTEGIADLVSQVVADFKKRFGHIEGVSVNGIGNRHGELVISGHRSFVFDERRIPGYFQGIRVHLMSGVLPLGFEKYRKYVWAPENWEDFVDENDDEVRRALDMPNADRLELLHALIGKPFSEWVDYCRNAGLTSRYAVKHWWHF